MTNPLAEARAFAALLQTGQTQAQVADYFGVARPTVANRVRLLRLPPSVRVMVAGGSLTEGHGKALLSVRTGPRRVALAERARRDRLSVRDLEALCHVEQS